MIGKGVFGTIYEVDRDKCRKVFDITYINVAFREIFGMLLMRNVPGISKIIEVEWFEDNLSIVMPKYKINLFNWIKSNPSIEERMKVVREIIKIISVIHRMGIIHSDLKLENIMLTENDEVVLIDWGFSGYQGKSLYGNTTKLYRSSILTGNYADEIYSLGILIIELFSNPIEKKYTLKEYDEIIDYLPIVLPLKDLIKRMICRNPRARPNIIKIANVFEVNIPEISSLDKQLTTNIMDKECRYPEFLAVDQDLMRAMVYNYSHHETYRLFHINCDLRPINRLIK